MILLIRSTDCFEPRVRNYLHYFDDHSIPYHVIAWDRRGTAQPDPHFTFYRRRAGYGKRIANIPGKLGWMFFIAKQIIRHRKDYRVIHGCDIDCILPALTVGKLLKKKAIYDIFDWVASRTGSGGIYRIIDWLQNLCYKHADAVILCEEGRKAQIKSHNDTVFIVPNTPNGDPPLDQTTLDITAQDLKEYDRVISYVGVFDRDRGIEDLLSAVSKCHNVKLNIAGFGLLEELVRKQADTFPNIHYWGRVEYAVGQAIIRNSHLLIATYHLTNPVHKFAAPNKYYESLAHGVPMVTTENTLVSTKVAEHNTGFVLDETEASLLTLLQQPDLEAQIAPKRVNCSRLWRERYRAYYEDYMSNQYMRFVAGAAQD